MITDVINFLTTPNGPGGLAMLIIKSTVVIGLGLLLWLSLKHSSASARHLVLGATLVATVLLPVISFVTDSVSAAVRSPSTVRLTVKFKSESASPPMTAMNPPWLDSA